MAVFFMQYKGREKAAKVVGFVAKWLNLCLSTVCEIGHGTLLKLEDKNFVLWVLLLKANKSSKLPWD